MNRMGRVRVDETNRGEELLVAAPSSKVERRGRPFVDHLEPLRLSFGNLESGHVDAR